MPFYEFQCPDCGTRFEKLVRSRPVVAEGFTPQAVSLHQRKSGVRVNSSVR